MQGLTGAKSSEVGTTALRQATRLSGHETQVTRQLGNSAARQRSSAAVRYCAMVCMRTLMSSGLAENGAVVANPSTPHAA